MIDMTVSRLSTALQGFDSSKETQTVFASLANTAENLVWTDLDTDTFIHWTDTIGQKLPNATLKLRFKG